MHVNQGAPEGLAGEALGGGPHWEWTIRGARADWGGRRSCGG